MQRRFINKMKNYEQFCQNPEAKKLVKSILEKMKNFTSSEKMKEGEKNEFYFFMTTQIANEGFGLYNKQDFESFQKIDYIYRMVREKIKDIGLDISKYPKTLEELTN